MGVQPQRCVAMSLWGEQWVAGAWLVSGLSVGFAVVRRVSFSAVILGNLSRRCVGGGLGLRGSWEGAGYAGSGWLGVLGGARVCGRCLHRVVRFSGTPACLPSAPLAVLSLLLSSAFPLPLFFFLGVHLCLRAVVGGCGRGACVGWGKVFAVLGVGVGACRCWCWCGRHGAVGWLWRPSLGRGCRGRWLLGGRCALGSQCVCRPSELGGFGFSGPVEAGSDPRGHLGVTWGVYLCAGKPPLADIILFRPPELTRCVSVIGLAIPAMSGHIQYRGAASGDLYIGISGINRVLLS